MKQRQVSYIQLKSLGDISSSERLSSERLDGNERTFTETPILETSRNHDSKSSLPRADIVAHPRYFATDQRTPGHIGPYRLLAKVGEGGMGEVYEAEQREPVRRRVALKLLKNGLNSREIATRFETERQALALMNHSGIAGVFDAGTTDRGRPYFVMELVSGLPITKSCDRHQLNLRRRIELFIEVCGAVQHAHQRGVIHRDLKPSNILVVECAGQFLPKIIDFGIAKAVTRSLTDQTLHTEFGRFIGTPEYMSPEQADLETLEVDTRADVYSLGVILYELLVGEKPFDIRSLRGQGLEKIRQHLCASELELPSHKISKSDPSSVERARSRSTQPLNLKRQIQGDLDLIVQKALEKDRSRRYGSPSALAADLVRHLENQPVRARAPSVLYRLGKFLKRRRTVVMASAAVMVAVLIGAGLGLWGWTEAQKKSDDLNRVTVYQKALLEMAHPGDVMRGGLPLDEVLERAMQELDRVDDPLLHATLATDLARNFRVRGEYDQAARLLDHALANREEIAGTYAQIAGTYAHEVAESLDERARLALDLADYRAARSSAEKALRIWEGGGGDPERVAETLLILVEIDLRSGVLAPAWHRLDVAFGFIKDHLGKDHLLAAEAWTLLGLLKGEYDPYKAAKDLQRGLAIRLQHLPESHPAIAWSWFHLGRNSLLRKELAEADAYLARAVSSFEQAYGAEHPAVGRTLVLSADLDIQARKMEAARLKLNKALGIFESVYEEAHPDLADYQLVYGYWLSFSNRSAEAEAALELNVRLREELHGPLHPGVASALESLGHFKMSQADHPAAEDILNRAITIIEHLAVPGDFRTAGPLDQLARLSATVGDLETARSRYEEVLRLRQEHFGEHHIEVARPLEALAALALRTGDAEHSFALEKRALTIREQNLGANHPSIASNYSRLGGLAGLRGDPGKMVAYHRRALEILEAAKGPDDPRVGSLLTGVALALMRQGKTAEALPLIARAENIADQSQGASIDVSILVYNLACVEVQRGRFSAAMLLLRRYVEYGFFDSWIAEDPDLLPLHELPEFQVLLEEVARHLE